VAIPFYYLSCSTEDSYISILLASKFLSTASSYCLIKKICLVNQISYNDKPNAELIMQSRKNADLVIRSVDLSS
jgi:hypothetical protein